MRKFGFDCPANPLYLDIDGVLNSHKQYSNKCGIIENECVDQLNRILRESDKIVIVISSAWRYLFNFDPLAAQAVLWSHGVNCYNRIHSCIEADDEVWSPTHPWTRRQWEEYGLKVRPEQILRHYESNTFLVNPVVVDDLQLNIPWLVKTDPQIGLTEEIADRIIRIFRIGEDDIR